MSQHNISVRELWCEREGKRIFGLAYVPQCAGRLPLVIFCHELGRNHTVGIPYAERLAAAGFAVYVFDFCGGSVGMENRSDGENRDMSVVTESRDVAAVLAAARGWDFVDPARITILGASQGGIAGMLAVSREPEKVSRIVMMYPPLAIADGARRNFGSFDAIPEEFDMFGGWIRVGRCYAADMWELNFYEHLARLPQPVLLMHGDRDHTADPAYSRRAAALIPDCEFHIIAGAGHHFAGPQFEEAMTFILRFLSPLLRENHATVQT